MNHNLVNSFIYVRNGDKQKNGIFLPLNLIYYRKNSYFIINNKVMMIKKTGAFLIIPLKNVLKWE